MTSNYAVPMLVIQGSAQLLSANPNKWNVWSLLSTSISFTCSASRLLLCQAGNIGHTLTGAVKLPEVWQPGYHKITWKWILASLFWVKAGASESGGLEDYAAAS